jgi:hypothetical protein
MLGGGILERRRLVRLAGKCRVGRDRTANNFLDEASLVVPIELQSLSELIRTFNIRDYR